MNNNNPKPNGMVYASNYLDMRYMEKEILRRDDLTEEEKIRMIDKELLFMDSVQRSHTGPARSTTLHTRMVKGEV